MYNSQKTKINQTKKKKINKKIIYIYIYIYMWCVELEKMN